ncbi:formamidopyrimidine-DNA glycosylase [Teratosphaeria destructans]|uniref:Formamidopyrimidine-DNA glycosylase n=1 Tax=Teratosphaeria destructans TaxID=418781 RepID=A0A9W7W267_9PEZI|nr:formamidopyrimidine-DNA glycosylase [Teratosphaeria destructans]
MHFGMTGWFKFSCEETGYYRDPRKKEEEWPPRFVKFLLKCEKEGDRDAVEAAFVDARRLARIRLVDCNADKIREESPLKENGPDPVRDKDIVTVDWLKDLLGRKRVPVKALILDQANLSGVGNWVADEILYQARVHPEQYSNTFDDDQIKRLHDSLIGVCTTAVETLADSTQFPEKWLMKYRWDKGKKDSNVLPNGQKIVHLKVGGRTSAIVPSVQKKTAAVAGDVDDGDDTPAKGRKRRTKAKAGGEDDEAEADTENEEKPASKKARASKAKSEAAAKKPSRAKKSPANGVKDEDDGDDEQADGGADDAEEADEDVKPTKKSAKRKKAPPKKPTPTPATSGSRRSTRTRS